MLCHHLLPSLLTFSTWPWTPWMPRLGLSSLCSWVWLKWMDAFEEWFWERWEDRSMSMFSKVCSEERRHKNQMSWLFKMQISRLCSFCFTGSGGRDLTCIKNKQTKKTYSQLILVNATNAWGPLSRTCWALWRTNIDSKTCTSPTVFSSDFTLLWTPTLSCPFKSTTAHQDYLHLKKSFSPFNLLRI